MSKLILGPKDAIYYEYTAPAHENANTLIFFNALTGETGNWESVIGPKVRAAGMGTLAYNMRGQIESPFSPDLTLGMDLIVNDALALMAAVNPPRPVLVGLSIGGLFAARAYLKGIDAKGLVMINTLRKDGPRLQWMGDALVRTVALGGLDLFRDLFLQLLVNEEFQKANRSNFLKPDLNYPALDPQSGHYKLLAEAGRQSDWNLPYEKLDLPTLVISGTQDHIFLEPDVVDELFAKLPNARRVDMPDAGHLIPIERPEGLADHLITFAKEVM